MLHDAMSFSDRSDKEVHRLEGLIDDLSWGFELHETFSLKQGITFKLGNAGHILGSCFIRFEIPTETPSSVIFSGDLGCTDTPILPDPDTPDTCDLLILESTYGDRNHTNRKDRLNALEKLLHKAHADKGIVYIPAFSLGRTQELIYELDRIGTKVPVFVDSPLGLKITKIYSDLEQFWDKEAKALKAKGDHPIDFKDLYAVEKYRDHKKLLNISGPAIIIAGSGMCTGGRIVDHLEHGLEDPANDIFFVGYQAKGTPGRRTPHLVSYTLNPEPCEARHSYPHGLFSPCRSEHAGQLGEIHAHAARGNPAGSWGKPRPPCPRPGIGIITNNHNKESLTPPSLTPPSPKGRSCIPPNQKPCNP